jgi:hypothetical protein
MTAHIGRTMTGNQPYAEGRRLGEAEIHLRVEKISSSTAIEPFPQSGYLNDNLIIIFLFWFSNAKAQS